MTEQLEKLTTRTAHQLSLEVPQGWSVQEKLTLLSPDGSGNVIASCEPLDGMGLEEYVELQGDLLRENFPDYREHRLEPVVVSGGIAGMLRDYGWTPEGASPTRQLQLYVVFEGRAITTTATSLESSHADLRALLTDTVLSLGLGGADA